MIKQKDISVIIPVFNNPTGIKRCILSLKRQSYFPASFEILIVDNGSTDATRKSICNTISSIQTGQEVEGRETSKIRLLNEDRIRSPYAARNRALEQARGEIIAFTDSDCEPEPDWLERGSDRLSEGSADLVAGEVQFSYSGRQTAAERYDSLINLEMRHNVETRGVAKTGNLFVRKEVFDRIGPFREDVRSGGDVEWTGRATNTGFRIIYDEDVIVKKQARKLGPLLKKLYRVGKGQPAIWKEQEGVTGMKALGRILYDLRPATPRFIRNQIKFRGHKNVPNSMISLMGVAWLCRLANGAGRVHGLFRFTR